MERKPNKWMQDAVKPENKGKLRERLHIKEGQKIPLKKLKKAAKSDDPTLRKEATLAETFRRVSAKKGNTNANRTLRGVRK